MSNEAVQLAHATADTFFDRHGSAFDSDLTSYHGHVHRVIGLVAQQVEVSNDIAPALGVAAFHHDVGIWLDRTWDYLPPSIERAVDALEPVDERYASLLEAIIGEHHRIRRAHHDDPLVEAFRLADRADVYHPFVGVPGGSRRSYSALVDTYPFVRFRRMLAAAFMRGLRENPRRPMSMMRL